MSGSGQRLGRDVPSSVAVPAETDAHDRYRPNVRPMYAVGVC